MKGDGSPDRSVHLRRAAPKLYQKPSTWMRDQIEGEEGLAKGAEAGAEAAADGVDVFSDEQAWDVLADIPNDSAAALVLIEHHWAVPCATRSPGRGLPAVRWVHQPAGPGRDRADGGRRGQGPARHGENRGRNQAVIATVTRRGGKP